MTVSRNDSPYKSIGPRCERLDRCNYRVYVVRVSRNDEPCDAAIVCYERKSRQRGLDFFTEQETHARRADRQMSIGGRLGAYERGVRVRDRSRGKQHDQTTEKDECGDLHTGHEARVRSMSCARSVSTGDAWHATASTSRLPQRYAAGMDETESTSDREDYRLLQTLPSDDRSGSLRGHPSRTTR